MRCAVLFSLVLSLILLSATSCATRKYRAAPIFPAASAATLRARMLSDPGLKEFAERNLGKQISRWPPESWNLDLLTLAAFYFNADLEATRARLTGAQAAVITSGARPNPDIQVAPGYETSPESPWLFAFSFDFPIETAGKRGHRIEQARSLNEAARLELGDKAWSVRSQIRTALLDYLLAVRELDLLKDQQQVLDERVKLLDARLQLGEIPRPELDSAQLELSNTCRCLSTKLPDDERACCPAPAACI